MFDSAVIMNSTLCTLETDVGSLDLLAEAPGSGGYDTLRGRSEAVVFDEITVQVASREDLLNMKRATGRSKDAVHIAELEDWLAEEADDPQPI